MLKLGTLASDGGSRDTEANGGDASDGRGLAIAAAALPVGNAVTVSTAAELMTALRGATGGETILLEAGDYGDLSLIAPRDAFAKFASTVTIKSADLQSLATFGSIDLRKVENLTFDSVVFDYEADPGAPRWVHGFNLVDSQGITVKNSIFDGDLATGTGIVDGFGTGIGFFAVNSTDVNVQGNEFYDWYTGAAFSSVSDLNVSLNEVHHVRSDGFNFANVDDVLIEGNHIHDITGAPGSGEHPDMIQFWTSGTTSPSNDIVIFAAIS